MGQRAGSGGHGAGRHVKSLPSVDTSGVLALLRGGLQQFQSRLRVRRRQQGRDRWDPECQGIEQGTRAVWGWPSGD